MVKAYQRKMVRAIPIGKKIRYNMYCHKDYIEDLIQNGYVPYVAFSRALLISSPTFNTWSEPVIDSFTTVNLDTYKVIYRSYADPLTAPIYHHKWLFVSDDYKGFDVEESKARSQDIISVMNSHDYLDKKRIGFRGYWEREVIPKLVQGSIFSGSSL